MTVNHHPKVAVHAVKHASLAHLIKVDLKAEAYSYTVDEDRQRYLELLDGKLLLVTNTAEPSVGANVLMDRLAAMIPEAYASKVS